MSDGSKCIKVRVVSQEGAGAVCDDPFDPDTCEPWLADTSLQLSAQTLPTRLRIAAAVRCCIARARVLVSGNGMLDKEFEILVSFNNQPALVANPRNIALRARAGGPTVSDTVRLFNQNVSHPWHNTHSPRPRSRRL